MVCSSGFASAGKRGVPGVKTLSTGDRSDDLGQQRGNASTVHHFEAPTYQQDAGRSRFLPLLSRGPNLHIVTLCRYFTGAAHFPFPPKLPLDNHPAASLRPLWWDYLIAGRPEAHRRLLPDSRTSRRHDCLWP